MMNKYAMTLARQALTAKDVRPVSPDKSDRIRDMISGHTASMDRWLPMRKTAGGEEESSSGAPAKWESKPLWDRKWRDIPGEERALLGLGVAGGGIAGYALSRLLHRKRNKWRTLAYVLGGAGGGLFGMDKLLDLPGEKGEDGKEGPSWRTAHLVKHTPEKKIREQSEQQQAVAHENDTDWRDLRHPAALVATGIGATQAAMGKGLYVDVSGQGLADRMVRQVANAPGYDWNDLPKFRKDIQQALQSQASSYAPMKMSGIWWRDMILHPFASRRLRAYNYATRGTLDIGGKDGRTVTGVTNNNLAGAGGKAANIGVTGAIYGGGTELFGWLMSQLGANVNKRDREVQKAVTPKR